MRKSDLSQDSRLILEFLQGRDKAVSLREVADGAAQIEAEIRAWKKPEPWGWKRLEPALERLQGQRHSLGFRMEDGHMWLEAPDK